MVSVWGVMKIVDMLRQAENILRGRGIATPRLDAEVLLAFCLGTERYHLYRTQKEVLSATEIVRFQAMVERRRAGEPVAYITGRKEFWSLEFEVDRSVLIPRPDTEVLVEETLRIAGVLGRPDPAVLEIGTGSGIISIALATELPGARLVAVDFSAGALAVARRNADRHGVASRIRFLRGNIFEPLSGKFDIVVSNPPYISEEEFACLSEGIRCFEPHEALISGPEGTEFHQRIISGGAAFLKPGGWIVMEIGATQKDALEKLLEQEGAYDHIGFRPDYAGTPRVVSARRKE